MMSEELVLVIPAKALADVGGLSGFSTEIPRFQPLLTPAARPEFRLRSEVETDPTWLQLIPYLVLRHRDRVFHYTRGQTGGETRLHARRSIGIGGHINPCDVGADAYRAGMLRELDEEVVIGGTFRDEVFGFVHDPSTPVGQVHFGVVHLVALLSNNVSARDPAITSCGFATMNELMAGIDSFESWSQLVLRGLN
jgi:predicted NUDIX family phosphoesterase